MRQCLTEVKPRHLKRYVTENGNCPYDKWFNGLKDLKGKAVIDARLIRLRQGNFGICRSVGDGVQELKIDFGPGYRVYFGLKGEAIVVLLVGGDKGSQEKNILKAKVYWNKFRSLK